ncbi:hypothetical protein BJ875DRAFT_479742 [Amylocarpus encephaloides]|uniref:Uncharacterized protein n=1 Tax=Amylocarpus encephaloides TaxID=45428 RepID=A0A9P7YS85_9HELO|nr:hypothetical protein BJ875DRAFT_479742 [Amylocarpus encephaloides]
MKACRWSDEEIRVFHDFIRPIHHKFEKMPWNKLGELMKALMNRRSGARREYTVTAMVNRFSKIHTVEGMTKGGQYQPRNMRYPTYLRPSPKPPTSRRRQGTRFSRPINRKVSYIKTLKKIEINLDVPQTKKPDKGESKKSAKVLAVQQKSTESDTESDEEHTHPAKRPRQSGQQLNHISTTTPRTQPNGIPRSQRFGALVGSKLQEAVVDDSSGASDNGSEFNFSEASPDNGLFILESSGESEFAEESEDEEQISDNESALDNPSGLHFSEYMVSGAKSKGKKREQPKLDERRACYLILKYGPTQAERGDYLEVENEVVEKEKCTTRTRGNVKPCQPIYCEGIEPENAFHKAMAMFELWTCRETFDVQKQIQIAHWEHNAKMDANAESDGFIMKSWA